MATGEMLPYLHFTKGDILWLTGWVPSSVGAMVGACIGLFLLAMCERWISALRAVMDVHWRLQYVVNSINVHDTHHQLTVWREQSSNPCLQQTQCHSIVSIT